MNDESKQNIDYHNKLKKLKLSETLINEIPKEYIDTLYQYHIDRKSLIIDENKDKKIKIILKLFNKILKLSDEEPIDDIKTFKTKRDNIIKKESQAYFESKFNDIFKLFDKKNHQYYVRKRKANYILSFLRSAVKEIGYEFAYSNKQKCVKVNGKNMFNMEITYFIK